ncbi:MAG: PAS domain S-box protein [Magnetococcales bacterium]|nr:PAS domain S-box protein [Magnetococcales bacterium]
MGITTRMLILTSVIITGIIASFIVFFVIHQKETILAQNERAMTLMVRTIGGGLRTIMQAGYASIVAEFVRELRENPAVLEFRILRTNGLEAFLDNSTIHQVNRTIGEQEFQPRNREERIQVLSPDDPNLQRVLREARILSLHHRHAQEPRVTLLAPIAPTRECGRCHDNTGDTLGILLVTVSLAQAEAEILTTRGNAFLLGFWALLGVLLVVHVMMRRFLVAPLGRLEISMNRIAEGHLEERLSVPGQDELSRIAHAFNDMALRLRVTHEGLRQERNKLGTIINSVREGIVVTDATGAVVMVNPATAHLLHKPVEQIEREGFMHLVDDPGYMRAYLDQEGRDMPNTLAYKDKVIYFHAATFKVDDVVIGSAAMLRDITEEFRLREQLREIIHQAPFGIVVTDDQETIHLFNPAAERLFGYRKAELIGSRVTRLIPASWQPRAGSVEAVAYRQNGGAVPIRLAVTRMLLDNRDAMLGMIVDMTEEMRLRQDLMQSAKMAGLGGMVAGVAHEINTPVGIGVTAASELQERMAIFARMIREDGISEEDLDACLASTRLLIGLILGNLERAANLVRSFKAVAVDQSSEKIRLFNMREYLESTVLTLRHDLGHTRLTVQVECAAELEVRADPGAFAQIVINLIHNSRLHAFGPDEAGLITLTCRTDGDRLEFVYRDNGRGMSEEVRSRIFEPFFTTRRDLGGSGLGMHIVYNLATRTLGGNIECESAPECGMMVRIVMPWSH